MGLVLIVEDEEKICTLLSEYLNLKGHEVKHHINGKEALEWLRENDADVILLDIVMPDISGLEFLKRIKEMGIAAKVVMISALRDAGTIGRAMDLGARAYLTKPFGFTELESSLAGLMSSVP